MTPPYAPSFARCLFVRALTLASCALLAAHADLLDTDPPAARLSDDSAPDLPVAADDFRPLGDTISKICAWGIYVKQDADGIFRDCAGEVTDKFYIAVLEPDQFGLPGRYLYGSYVSPGNVAKSHQVPTRYEDTYDIYVFAYSLTLDKPITGLDASGNTTYWLQILNTTDDPPDNTCTWAWFQTATHYNNYSAAGDSYYGYSRGAFRTRDFAFCIDSGYETPDPVIRACCPCDGTCTETTVADCPNAARDWDVTAFSCAGVTCLSPDNDDCATVVDPGFPALIAGSYDFDNQCATTDGPNPFLYAEWPRTIINDLWFKYVAECDGETDISACWNWPWSWGPQLFAYRDPENPATCPCPTEITKSAWLYPAGLGSSCTCIPDGTAICSEIRAGDCLMIRIGGWDLPDLERVQDTLWVGCRPLSSPSPWDDRCNGGSNHSNVCGTNADCPGGSCGTKNRYLSFLLNYYELSDPGYQITIVNVPSSPSLNGQIRWLAPQQAYADGPGSPSFQAATLQCAPLYRYWGFNRNVHAYGPEIQPASTYEIRMCRASDGLCSPPLTITTAKWGDLVAPFAAGQPNFQDVAALVDKFQNKPTAINRPRAQLHDTLVDPAQPISFLDIADDVNAFAGKPFPYSISGGCP